MSERAAQDFLRLRALVVVDRVARRDQVVVPSVVQEQFPLARHERPQIRIDLQRLAEANRLLEKAKLLEKMEKLKNEAAKKK